MNAAVGIFANHAQAEAAVKELDRAGIDMRSLSIVGKDYHTEESVVGYYNTGDRMKTWGKQGAFWGSMWGLLFGSAFFLVPGVGPLLVGGPLVSAIVGAVEGAAVVGGLSALGAALYSIGIPKDSVLRYETALSANNYLVVVHDAGADVSRAREILTALEAEALAQPTVAAAPGAESQPQTQASAQG